VHKSTPSQTILVDVEVQQRDWTTGNRESNISCPFSSQTGLHVHYIWDLSAQPRCAPVPQVDHVQRANVSVDVLISTSP
jgi:hypothetical protein